MACGWWFGGGVRFMCTAGGVLHGCSRPFVNCCSFDRLHMFGFCPGAAPPAEDPLAPDPPVALATFAALPRFMLLADCICWGVGVGA